jgi:hypothetical protein
MTPNIPGTLTMALHRGQNPIFLPYTLRQIYVRSWGLSGENERWPFLLYCLLFFGSSPHTRAE